MFWMSIIGIVAAAALCWTLYRHVGASRMDEITNKRRSTSRMVSLAEFVDGSRHLKVALALTGTDLFYENGDMQASLDLRWVREVEYDTRLATGHAVEGGKVMRLRCFSQVFEFIIANADLVKWHMMLPARAQDELPVIALPVAIAT